MKLSRCSALLACLAAAGSVSPASADNHVATTFSAKILVDSATALCSVIKPTAPTQRHRGIKTPSDIVEQTVFRQNRISKEEILILQDEPDAQKFVEIIGGSVATVETRMTERCPLGINSAPSAIVKTEPKRLLRHEAVAAGDADTPVIKKIVDSGDPSNRIDVVFMGDGYTIDQETRFFDDIQRLTDEMFTGDTFAQYLPLFNVWAVLQPSAVSGIGTGGTPKNTAFGLYRDGTELRGVYTSKAAEARRVCALVGASACDFPSIIGNDDFYGGLGGEFVISTRSPTSGTIVLRHEMGHNFGKVGEEYDGGSVYSGANSAASLSAITWKHWLTNPSVIREEKEALTYTNHMWYDLKNGPYKISFTATGKYKRWLLVMTASGAETDSSLSIMLDGKPLAWKSSGIKDRTFYTWENRTQGFSAGKHEIVVTGKGPFNDKIIQQLCSIDLNEYMDESEFAMEDNEVISAYPTWDGNNRKTYRPNNEKCLMRNMLSTSFCSVCIENMWLKFFERVQLIDNVEVTNTTNVAVKVIPLGQFRANQSLAGNETLTVQWLKGGVEQTQFKNQFQVNLATATGGASGSWTVRVKFQTPAVRLDSKNLLQSEKTFTI